MAGFRGVRVVEQQWTESGGASERFGTTQMSLPTQESEERCLLLVVVVVGILLVSSKTDLAKS